MERISTASAGENAVGPGKRGFVDGNLAIGQPPTAFNAHWCNSVQEEVAGPVEASGQTLDPDDSGQLLKALKRIAGRSVKTVSVAGTTVLTGADSGLVLVDATAGDVVLTLPAATVFGAGVSASFVIMRADASANNVLVRMSGTDTFEPGGISLAALATNPCRVMPRERLEVMSNGDSAWYGMYQGTQRYAAFAGGGSGNWLCPPFITRISAKLWGAGGSGGASSSTSGAGGGGGGGGFARVVTSVQPNTSYPYTVGAGGAAKSGSASGDTGGSTAIFGIVATGGGPGIGSSGSGGVGGVGGSSAGASFSVAGSSGGSGYQVGTGWGGGVGGGTFSGASNTGPNVAAPGLGGSFPGGGGNGGAGVNDSGAGGAGLIELDY